MPLAGLVNLLMVLMVAGGTFALYSLICRYAKVSLLPNQQRVDEDISSFRLKLPTPELERAMFVKDCLEKKPLFKNIILFLVLMGTSMVDWRWHFNSVNVRCFIQSGGPSLLH